MTSPAELSSYARRLTLPFTRPPVSSNQARSGHWSAQHRAKRNVETAVFALCKQHRVPVMDRITVTLTWHAPDNRTRDPDGLGPMLKAVLDGIRKAGVVRDDSAHHVRAVTLVVEPASPSARIDLLIEEVP